MSRIVMLICYMLIWEPVFRWDLQCKWEHCGCTYRSGQEELPERTGGRFQRRVTPSLSLSGEHMARDRMISCLQVPEVSQPLNTMLSTDRSAGTHGQPSTGKHPQEFLTHVQWAREVIYKLMLFPWVKQSHLLNNVTMTRTNRKP